MQLDYSYVSHWSFASDLRILARTLAGGRPARRGSVRAPRRPWPPPDRWTLASPEVAADRASRSSSSPSIAGNFVGSCLDSLVSPRSTTSDVEPGRDRSWSTTARMTARSRPLRAHPRQTSTSSRAAPTPGSLRRTTWPCARRWAPTSSSSIRDTVVRRRNPPMARLDEISPSPGRGNARSKLVLPDGRLDHACKRRLPHAGRGLGLLPPLDRLAAAPRASSAGYRRGSLDPDEGAAVDAMSGAFMLVRRETVDDIGLLDEGYWMYSEDLDWCARVSIGRLEDLLLAGRGGPPREGRAAGGIGRYGPISPSTGA